ncbi:hypothetical protein D3C80_2214700 [compost metagenome]
MATTDRGTVEANVPMDVPTRKRVTGMSATTSSRNGKERTTLTILFSVSDRLRFS